MYYHVFSHLHKAYQACHSKDTIIKRPESGELCEEITESVLAEDHVSPQGDLPPPQTK